MFVSKYLCLNNIAILKKIPAERHSLVDKYSICSDHVMFSSSMTPRYFSDLTLFNKTFPNMFINTAITH